VAPIPIFAAALFRSSPAERLKGIGDSYQAVGVGSGMAIIAGVGPVIGNGTLPGSRPAMTQVYRSGDIGVTLLQRRRTGLLQVQCG
jgi:hypothetical protein